MKIEGTELVRDEEYARLLSRVQGQIQTGRERLKQLADLEALRLYWQIGESVGRFLKTVDQPYGRKVVARLATDIEMSPSVLYDAIRFRELFLKFPARGILTWTHYRQVMGVMTREGRDYYLDEAERAGVSVNLRPESRRASLNDLWVFGWSPNRHPCFRQNGSRQSEALPMFIA